MKPLHAGYVSGAVWNAIQNAIQNEKLSPELDWQDVLNRLSHFVIDSDVGGQGVLPPELSVLENILCRGLPTLPSLYIEEELARMTGLVRFGTSGNKAVAAYSCEFEPNLSDRLIPFLERALCVVAPKGQLEPSRGFIFPEFGSGEESTKFDSQAEKQFWDGPLAKLLGPGGMQLALRQRPLSTIAGQGFIEQRTDVTVQFPGSQSTKGIVLEVDGPTHGTPQSRSGDDRRDEACTKAGWAQTYRHQLWNGRHASDSIDMTHAGVSKVLQHPYLRRVNENVKNPLASDEFGRRVQVLALFPLAVARIQRVILELVRGGVLSLDAPSWDLAVLDRDGLPNCGVTAAQDFSNWLLRIWAIYKPGLSVPVIRIHEISQNETNTTLPKRIDALLDVSVQLRYGVSLPTPPGLQALGGIPNVIIRSDYFNSEPYHRLAFGDPLTPQIKGDALERELTFFLQNIFRKVSFREKQTEIIMRALRGESVIALLPTGAGKSITYQLPTLLQNGMSIVVDPIKSLMKDQNDNLKAMGITSSAFINSMPTAKERRLNTELMQQGCFKFVFVSPERFIIQEFRDALNNIREKRQVYFAYAVVDEAHCVSEWGHDFRTAYLRLGENARRFCATRLPELPLVALTGTASFDVLEDIKIELDCKKESNIDVRPESMERPNLIYKVVSLKAQPRIPIAADEKSIRKIIGEAKLLCLPEIIGDMTQALANLDVPSFINNGKGSGLVFCPHARWVHGAEDARTAMSNAFEQIKDTLGVYYGSPEENTGELPFDPVKTQDDFKKGVLKVLACTKAFGMGIDKPDIRFTLHYNIPPSLESFYQEAGRAGRDEEDAQCWVLYAGTPVPGTSMSGKSLPTVDYALNHSFYANSFPGAHIEEAKVFEMLDQNRVSGHSVLRDIESMLHDNTGIEYTLGTYHQPVGGLYRVYINHTDYRDAKVYVNVLPNGGLSVGATSIFPNHELVSGLVMDWLNDNKPADMAWKEWLFDKKMLTINAGPGIEELLDKTVGHEAVCISLDNSYLVEIAGRVDVSLELVRKAYKFVKDADEFIGKLKLSPNNNQRDWIITVFPKIRLQEHSFRAIYRLTILGAVDDFVVDYGSSKSITATILPPSPGIYRENLRNYIYRYAPMDVAHYLELADQCDYSTELRRCLHALIQFVYGRIAKQRLIAMEAMETATQEGIKDPNALADTVKNYFDSPYISKLRPNLNEYTSELVFDMCIDTAGAPVKLRHLLGACIRLLEQNPNNAAFYAMRAYAYALLGYVENVVKSDIDAALLYFQTYHQWGRMEKLTFLIRLRTLIAGMNLESARVFDAAIIEDHTTWLQSYNAHTKTVTM